MKTFRFLALALLALGVLASCSKENNNTSDGGKTPVAFAPTISGAQATRASGTAWANGDAIGVFMTTAGQTLSGSNIADNVQYTNSGSDFTTTTPIYYPLSGAVDFVAYYPYTSTLPSNTYKVDVGNQISPANIDLLYSNNATGKSKNTTAVPLVFDHKLSQVVLNIEKGVGMATVDLSTMKITIAGMPTKADFKLVDGTFSNEGTTAAITPRTVTVGTQYDAIVIPQAANSYTGRKMVFTVGADVYEYALPNGDDFVSGKSYAYTVTVAKTGVTVSASTITDWTGTTETPGDLGEAAQLPIPMVLIPAGTFIMGSPTTELNRDNDETQHSVTLTKDFYMSKYAITFAQYDAYCTAKGITPPSDQGWGRGDRPVINVSWNDAVAYCAWLSTETGLTYSLPTEAQWEYACRGGTTTAYSFGADATDIGDYAWHISNSGNKTHVVGEKNANAWGLYDMHGNVFEWCSDWYDSGYGNNSQEVSDPTGPATGSYRVLRGGSWGSDAQYCRSAYRNGSNPGHRDDDVGFRVVFVP